MKKNENEENGNDGPSFGSMVLAGTGMAAAGGILTAICPAATAAILLGAFVVAVVGESCKGGGGDADGRGG